MQLGRVLGHATATIRHPSMRGRRLLVVQMLNAGRQPEADPVLAIDTLGAASSQVVVIDSDGRHARELVGDEKSPIRWYTVGIVDA